MTKLLLTILLVLLTNISFSQTFFDCTNVPEADQSFIDDWEFIRDEFLSIKGKNIYNHNVGLASATKFCSFISWIADSKDNWQPKFQNKEILAGKLKKLYLYDTYGHVSSFLDCDKEFERDWNFWISPMSKFEYLINSQENYDEWHTDGDKFVIECEISPSSNILFGDKNFFQFSHFDNKFEGSVFEGNLKPQIEDDRICIYGPALKEKKHNFRPEIHPAELIWFKHDTHSDSEEKMTLMILQDGSNRFYDYDDFLDPEEDFKAWAESPIFAEFKYTFKIDPIESKSFNILLVDEENTYSQFDSELGYLEKEFLNDGVTDLVFNNITIGKIFHNSDKIGVNIDTNSLMLDKEGNLIGYILIKMIVSKPAKNGNSYFGEDQPGYAFINLTVKKQSGPITHVIVDSNLNSLVSEKIYNDSLIKIFKTNLDSTLSLEKKMNPQINITTNNNINPVKKTKYFNLENRLIIYDQDTVLEDIKGIELEKIKKGDTAIRILDYKYNKDKNLIITDKSIPVVVEGKLKFILENSDTLFKIIPGIGLNHIITKDTSFTNIETEFNFDSQNDSNLNLLNNLNGLYHSIEKSIVEVSPVYYNTINGKEADGFSLQVNTLNEFLYSENLEESKIADYFGKKKFPFKIEWKSKVIDVISEKEIIPDLDLNTIVYKKNKNLLINQPIIEYSFPKQYKDIPIKIKSTGILTDTYGLKDTIEIIVYNYKVADINKDSLLKKFFFIIADFNNKKPLDFWELANKEEKDMSLAERYQQDYIEATYLKTLVSNLIYYNSEKLSDIKYLRNLKF